MKHNVCIRTVNRMNFKLLVRRISGPVYITDNFARLWSYKLINSISFWQFHVLNHCQYSLLFLICGLDLAGFGFVRCLPNDSHVCMAYISPNGRQSIVLCDCCNRCCWCFWGTLYGAVTKRRFAVHCFFQLRCPGCRAAGRWYSAAERRLLARGAWRHTKLPPHIPAVVCGATQQHSAFRIWRRWQLGNLAVQATEQC